MKKKWEQIFPCILFYNAHKWNDPGLFSAPLNLLSCHGGTLLDYTCLFLHLPLVLLCFLKQKQCPTDETMPHYRNSAQIEKQSNLKNFFLSLVKLKDKLKFMHVLSRLQINTTFIINKTVREMTQPPPYHFLCLWLWLQARNNSVTSRPGPQWPGISDISQATVCKRQ